MLAWNGDITNRLYQAINRIKATGIDFPLATKGDLIVDDRGHPLSLIDTVRVIAKEIDDGSLEIVVVECFG